MHRTPVDHSETVLSVACALLALAALMASYVWLGYGTLQLIRIPFLAALRGFGPMF